MLLILRFILKIRSQTLLTHPMFSFVTNRYVFSNVSVYTGSEFVPKLSARPKVERQSFSMHFTSHLGLFPSSNHNYKLIVRVSNVRVRKSIQRSDTACERRSGISVTLH